MTDAGAALKILCIEDNPVNWRLVQRLLGQAGYAMHWAEEGLKGFEMAMALRPDLILLDINLPGLSGFEVATKLRQQPELKGMPVVALTAKTQRSDRETALVAGCDGFIPKPIDPFTFVRQVEGYLHGRRDTLEKTRETTALRQFNVQMLEHVEAQLREAQEANQKLLEAQAALEARNRSLGRLLALSRDLLQEHAPDVLLRRILDQVRAEVAAEGLWAYRLHASGSYWEGLRWDGEALVEAPVLALDHAFPVRLQALAGKGVLDTERLRANRAWDEGLALGLWKGSSQCALLAMRDRMDEEALWGFWIFTRGPEVPFQPLELELMTLHAGMATVALENAELIDNLNESTRALASSYERIETAYQDLQNARADLGRRDRQVLMEELFVKIAHRLETPVAILKHQSADLERTVARHTEGGVDPSVLCPVVAASVEGIRQAVGKVDGLLRALLRRVAKEGPASPEWLDLHDLLQQELEFLGAEAVLPPGLKLELELQAGAAMAYGVYGDFARLLQYLVQHALAGPTPTGSLQLRTWSAAGRFHLELKDAGGPVPPTLLPGAFEPFGELHASPVKGVRAPGQDLPACHQLLAVYHGEMDLRNEGEGTVVHVAFPLR
jgi:DNA-binding response OmpR family regulator/signal transduction histidine kinase